MWSALARTGLMAVATAFSVVGLPLYQLRSNVDDSHGRDAALHAARQAEGRGRLFDLADEIRRRPDPKLAAEVDRLQAGLLRDRLEHLNARGASGVLTSAEAVEREALRAFLRRQQG